jgi:hypothetical protein
MTSGLVNRDGESIQKGRISPALRTAVTLIVHEGLTVKEAAERTGYQWESLSKALLKPHVKAMRTAVKRAWLTSKTEKAWLTVAELAEGSASDDIRLKASKIFLEQAGELNPEGVDSAKTARTLINIVLGAAPQVGQPTPSRLPGVIEAPHYRDISPRRPTIDELDEGEEGDFEGEEP